MTNPSQIATKQDLQELEFRVDKRFEKIDERFVKIDQRFEKIDEKFEKIDMQFEKIDQRFEKMENSLVQFKNEIIHQFGVITEQLLHDFKSATLDKQSMHDDKLADHHMRIGRIEKVVGIVG